MFKVFRQEPKSIDKSPITNHQIFFEDDEIIVSKTDAKGKITYVNDIFIRVSGYSEEQLLGQPHSIIRHPDMPRCIFEYLWQNIKAGEDVSAYVNNRTINGDNYWVFAFVSPSFDENNQITSYHSSRRCAKRETVKNIVAPLYKHLLTAEQSAPTRKQGLKKSTKMLNDFIAKQGVSYNKFILSI